MTEIQKELFALQDKPYGDFQAKLIPNVPRGRIIGIRTPALRAFARSIWGTERAAEFIRVLPHEYYEENNLHGFLIEQIKDPAECVRALDAFLPYVDNWATCDQIRPAVFKKHRAELISDVRRWMASGHCYTRRFGIGMLMAHYLDEDFRPEYLDAVAAIRSDEYYIRMMQVWYFATALAKQYDAALPYIEKRRLDEWTHNKAIQKATESYRVSGGHKAYLRTLKL